MLELTYNHDGRTYELGTGYGHIAIGVDDLDGTLARLGEQGIEPERAPYQVREGGSLALLRPRPGRLPHRADRRVTFTLAQLEDAIRGAWSEDTASRTTSGAPRTRAAAQCDITTLVVHDLLGGEVLAADVFLDGERVEAHMWNRLASGLEVDLTREQFRSGQVIGEPTRAARGPRRSTRPIRATTATSSTSCSRSASARPSACPIRTLDAHLQPLFGLQ